MLKFFEIFSFYSLIRGFHKHPLREICHNFRIVNSISMKFGESVENRLKQKVKDFGESCFGIVVISRRKTRMKYLRAPLALILLK